MAGASEAKKKTKNAKAARTSAAPRSRTRALRNWFDDLFERHVNVFFVAGAKLFFVAMLALKFSFYYVEGLASVALLIFGAVFLWKYHDAVFPLRFKFSEDSVWLYVGLFAFLGFIFDGAGNAFYNKPLELLCPTASRLAREVVSIETSDGTEFGQAFICVSRIGGENVEIAWYLVDMIRIAEYIVIAFVLIAVCRAILFWKHAK